MDYGDITWKFPPRQGVRGLPDRGSGAAPLTINVILFGFGRAGRIHYQNCLDNPNLCLTHVVDVCDLSHVLPHDIQYVDYNNKQQLNTLMNNKDIIAVIVASPTYLHFETIMLSLNFNKHVFVEKPISNIYDNIHTCFDLAEKKGLTLFVGFNRRFDPTLMNIRKKIQHNEIGKVHYAITISRDYPYPTKEYLNKSSGMFNDCASHDIDYMCWILKDKPVSVTVSASPGENHNYDHVAIHFKYSLGTIVSMNLSRIASSYDQRCEFYGYAGEILNNSFPQNQKLSFPERYAQSYKNELQDFYMCVIQNNIPSVSKDDCLNNYIIAKACQEAVDKNKIVTIKYGDTEFRNFSSSTPQRVKDSYLKARTNQTFEFVTNIQEHFGQFDIKMNMWDILENLNHLVDVSDPDISHPNMFHAFQTAEMMKQDNLPDWMQLVGLLHDIGKIMYLKGSDETGTGKKEQWAMVGDTFVVGCQLPDTLVFPEFNSHNPDMKDKYKSTKNGIYKEGCGLDNLICSWGHDEYLYRILSSNKNPNSLPPEALYIIRFHSLYAYHDKLEYMHFQSQKDKSLFHWLKLFSKYDLYSKTDILQDQTALKSYYSTLIHKYFKNDYLFI